MNAELNKVVPIIADKTCARCELVKPVSEFGFWDIPKNDGYSYTCKQCVSADVKAKRKAARENGISITEAQRVYNQRASQKYQESLAADPEKKKAHLERMTRNRHSPVGRNRYYKAQYGITYEEVCVMHNNQHGLCANHGCGKEISLTAKRGKEKAHVDHCHETGAVRALLCHSCNLILGYIEPNKNAIFGLLDYLKTFSKNKEI